MSTCIHIYKYVFQHQKTVFSYPIKIIIKNVRLSHLDADAFNQTIIGLMVAARDRTKFIKKMLKCIA